MDALKDFIFPCNRAVSRVNQNDFRTLESATPPQFWLNLADRSKFQAHETFRDRVRAERAEPARNCRATIFTTNRLRLTIRSSRTA